MTHLNNKGSTDHMAWISVNKEEFNQIKGGVNPRHGDNKARTQRYWLLATPPKAHYVYLKIRQSYYSRVFESFLNEINKNMFRYKVRKLSW